MIPFLVILAKERVSKEVSMNVDQRVDGGERDANVSRQRGAQATCRPSLFLCLGTPSDLGRLMEDSCELQAQFFKGG